jgi:hypothetical protein
MDDHRDRGELPKMICDEVPTGFDQDEEVLCVLPSIDLMELRAVRHSIQRGRSAMAVRPSESLAGCHSDSAAATALATP